MDRGQRRDITERKYISRIKERLHWITGINTWKDAEENIKWVKLLKHNKLYGRSTMNVLEKHYKVKKLREESKNITREVLNN